MMSMLPIDDRRSCDESAALETVVVMRIAEKKARIAKSNSGDISS